MAVPQWTQNSGYKLGTLPERVTTSITLPIAPGLTLVLQKSAFLHNQEYQTQL